MASWNEALTLASKIQQSFDRYWLNFALILQRCCFPSFESRADPQFSTTPGSMKTATKFPPILDRVCTRCASFKRALTVTSWRIAPRPPRQSGTRLKRPADRSANNCAAAGLQHHPFRDSLAQVLARKLADAQQRAMRLRGSGSGAAGDK
jgi:hypothetical protein